MTIFELIVIAIGVSLDAFSVAICKGLAVQELSLRHGAIVGAYFGGFQALMPLLGFFVGTAVADYIRAVDHWVILLILLVLGIQMLREAWNPESCPTGDFSVPAMLPLAFATSIDAFAVGITFAVLEINIFFAVTLIGLCTFLFSFIGVYIGHFFGGRYQKPAGIAGGLLLIGIGIKIFLQHLVAHI